MQSAFGAGFLWGTPVGGAPVMFAALQSCSMDASFDQKMLYGQKAFAEEMARGKGKIDFKATTGRIDPVLFNSIFWGGAATPGQVRAATGEAVSVPPSGPFTVSAANASNFRVDLGVFDPTAGRFLTRVAASPQAGQYSASAGGVYTFASTDAGLTRKLYYTWGSGSTGATINVGNPPMDAGPVFRADLVQSFRGRSSVITAWACQAFKFAFPLKQDDFTLPDISFSAMDDGTGAILTHSMDGY